MLRFGVARKTPSWALSWKTVTGAQVLASQEVFLISILQYSCGLHLPLLLLAFPWFMIGERACEDL